MERRELGRAKTTPTHRQLLLWTLGYALVAFALLSMQRDAAAATLVDVRIGEHNGYTRIVLELDSLAAYQVSEPREGKNAAMRIELDARGGAQEIDVADAVIAGIRVEPSGKSTSIHVDLEKAAVQINEMILLDPPRLVFDIRDPARVAAAPKASRKPVAKIAKVAEGPKKTPPPERAPSQRVAAATKAAPAEVQPEPSKNEAPAASTTASSAAHPTAKRDTPAPTSGETPVKRSDVVVGTPPAETDLAKLPGTIVDTAGQGAPAAPGAGSDVAQHARDGEPTAAGASAQIPGGPLPLGGANAGRPNSLVIPAPPPMAVANRASENKLAVPPLPSQRSGGTAESAASGDGMLDKARAFVGGINKLVLAGVGLLVALALFFVVRRGRVSDDPLSPVMAANDLGGEGDDLFAAPNMPGQDMEATEPVPTDRSKASPPPPPAPAGEGRLENRVAQLESALAQLTQSRENIERQLAAQTEELRVQRAAIARTQRVVRSIGDGEEEHGGATEPVPRAPVS